MTGATDHKPEVTNDIKAREKVWELIKDIRVAQLVTHDGANKMHARPMVAIQKEFEGVLWFYTSKTSPKIDEIKHNSSILLSYAEPSDQNYVSITGEAEIVTDQSKIKELWSEYLRTWFPKGVEDPDIALLKVTVDNAEYWDSPSSTLVHIYGYVKARITGESPKAGENKIVKFN